jgi:hypothetical protein
LRGWGPRSSIAELRPEDDGRFVAIGIGSGSYEIDEDDYPAVSRLRAYSPPAEVWLGRIGQRAAYRMRPTISVSV